MFRDEVIFGLAAILLFTGIVFGYQFNLDPAFSSAASADLFAAFAFGFTSVVILISRMIFGPYHKK